jgi:hypothetical protein
VRLAQVEAGKVRLV